MRRKSLTERIDVRLFQLQPGRRPVPTEAAEMLRTGIEPREQIEAANAAPRSAPRTLTIERNHHHGPVVALDQPRGDDPNHARVPVPTGDNQARSLPQPLRQIPQRHLSRVGNLPLRRPPLAIGTVQLDGNLGRPSLILGEEKLNPRIGAIKPPSRIDPRSKTEAQIALVEPGHLAFGRRDQRPHTRPRSPPYLLQPLLHQRPVLPHQRHHIGHRRQRNKIKISA